MTPSAVLQTDNVGRLRALLAIDNVELDFLVLVKGLITVHLDRAEMDENVLALFGRDEAEALGAVEPFHFAFQVACLQKLYSPLVRGSADTLPERETDYTTFPANCQTQNFT